ncbi:ABC transporter ATP-binding protein [Amycolatopsis jejuensis]|uniref:ABC transporter ATP-binding protein n=1 Tax=Amycolatopsis jejuensis TaxID=330084 RepID=UPI0005278E18|nr:ABC transporter ATP-binding protein [Amycolatopsis jejuensis]
MSEALLEVEDLSIHYPMRRGMVGTLARRPRNVVHAVDGISFRLGRGEMVAVVGESGCGKSTTAKAICGLVSPTGGTVRLEGSAISGLPERRLRPIRRRVQMIYQDPYESLDPLCRVRDILAEPMLIHGIGGSRAEREKLAEEALERSGLSPASAFLARYPHELSGGQRQRVAIAAALVLDPDVLLADEPVSMLDVSVRAGVLSLLDTLRKDQDTAILMITHDLSTAAHFADRIVVMYLGRIVEQGPAHDVIHNPQHPYTKALLSAVPRRDRQERAKPQLLSGETPDPVDIPDGCRFRSRCPVGTADCERTDPPLVTVGAGHEVACLYA